MSKKYFDRLARSSGASKTEFTSDFGLKILKKFGWEAGKGLGENLEGTTDCVQVSRREERVGLGGEKTDENQEAQWDNWWSSAYNSVAQKLPAGPQAGTSADASDDASSEEDNEKRATCIKAAKVMGGKLARICRQEGAAAGGSGAAKTMTDVARAAKKESGESGSDTCGAAAVPAWLLRIREFRAQLHAKLQAKNYADPIPTTPTTSSAPTTSPENGPVRSLTKGGKKNTAKGDAEKPPVLPATTSGAAEKKKKKKTAPPTEAVPTPAEAVVTAAPEKRKADPPADAPRKKKKKTVQ